MNCRLFFGEIALVHQRLHISVIPGNADELPVAQQIATRVTDMAHAQAGAVEKQSSQRSAHALRRGVLLNFIRNGVIALYAGAAQGLEQIGAGLIIVQPRDSRDHQLGCDFPGGVATHAVGKREQTRTRIGGVLVVLSDEAAVRAGRVIQSKTHGCNLKVVRPIRNSIPEASRSGCSTR